MTTHTFTPGELLLLLGADGFKPEHDVFVDPDLFQGVDRPALEKAQDRVTQNGWVKVDHNAIPTLSDEILTLTRSAIRPRACLAVTRQDGPASARAYFCNFTTDAVVVNRATDKNEYVFEMAALEPESIVDSVLAYCSAADTVGDVPVAETCTVNAQVMIGAADLLSALARAAQSAGLDAAQSMRDQMQGGRLLTVKATVLERQPVQIRTLTWAEKPGLRWAFSGLEGGDTVTISHMNGPALRNLLRDWIVELAQDSQPTAAPT